MANGCYNKGIAQVFNGGTDLDTSDLRVLLVKTTYTFNKDHAFVDDGTANDPLSHEIGVSGYARQTLASKTVTQDDTNDLAYLDATDVDFTGMASGETIGGVVLFRHTGTDTTAPLIAFYALASIPTSITDLTIKWAAPANGGVLKGASA